MQTRTLKATCYFTDGTHKDIPLKDPPEKSHPTLVVMGQDGRIHRESLPDSGVAAILTPYGAFDLHTRDGQITSVVIRG